MWKCSILVLAAALVAISGCRGKESTAPTLERPIAVCGVSAGPYYTNESVRFYNDGSRDPGGGIIVKYEWDWNNDGIWDEEGKDVSHTWTSTGDYMVRFRVTDNDGETDTLAAPLEIPVSVWLPTNVVDRTPGWLNFHAELICTQDGYAYAVGQSDRQGDENRLDIFDISVPDKPVWVNRVYSEGRYPRDICASDGYVYVVAQEAGLWDIGILSIIDVRLPLGALVVRAFNCGPGPVALTVSDGLAFIADSSDGLNIADVDPPGEAQMIKTKSVSYGCNDVACGNGYVYLASHTQVSILDVSRTGEVSCVGLLNSDLGVRYLAASGEYVFGITDGVEVWDVIPPQSAYLVSKTDIGGYLIDLVVEGNFAYIGGDSLRTVDISIPAAPVLVSNVETSWIVRPAFWDGVVYATYANPDRPSNIQIVDVEPPLAAHVVNTARSLSFSTDVAITEGYALVGNVDGLDIVDTDPSESAHIVEHLALPNCLDVAIDGKYAYVLNFEENNSRGYLRIFDIENPESAFEVNAVVTQGYPSAVYVSDGLAYVAADGLSIYDVEPPESARLLNHVHYDAESPPQTLDVSNGYAYVPAGWGDLTIVDVDPVESANYLMLVPLYGSVNNVLVKDGYAYATNSKRKLYVVGLYLPYSAWAASEIELPGLANNGMAFSKGYLFVMGYYGYVVDIASPESPHLETTVQTLNTVWDLAMSGRTAYVAAEGGFGIFEFE
jgi:hypothetical protein